MTEEKNINASAEKGKEKDKFADEVLTENELDNVTGGTVEAYEDIELLTTGK